MIETPALILRVAPGQAWVEPRPHKPCGMCDPDKGCRTLAIARMFSRNDQTFCVQNPLDVQPGEWVTIAVPERGVLQAAFLMYTLPLVGLFFGALLGALWGDIWSAVAGVVGLLLALGAVRLLPVKWIGKQTLPHIVARIDVNTLNAERVCRSKNS